MSRKQDEVSAGEAADWFSRLRSTAVTNEDLAEFSRWRRLPGRAAAYEQVEELWGNATQLSGDPAVMAAVADASRRRPVEAGRVWRRILPLAMASVAGFSALFLLLLPTGENTHETGIGEGSTVRLDDGTRVQLDTATTLEVEIGDDRRLVHLRAGRAFFDVQTDPARPFIVEAGGISVTALGTKFEVRRKDAGVRVDLVQGRVLVEREGGEADGLELKPWQTVTLAPAGMRPRPARLDPLDLSWREGRLTFSATPLKAAIGEMNRYSEEPIRLVDPALASKPVSGVFSTADPRGFARAVRALFGPDAIVVDARS